MGETRLTMKSLQAWVTVDGKELKTYGVETNDAKREVSCWIASEVDKEFSVNLLRTSRAASDCDFLLYLDGHYSGRKSCLAGVVNIPRTRSYFRISPVEVRNYMFGPLELTDDDNIDESLAHNIGEIRMIVRQGRVKLSTPPSSTFRQAVHDTGLIHERSKKALVHQVKYAEGQRSKAKIWNEFIESNTGVRESFIFRYRPFAMLQANDIAPRDPAPRPVPEEQTHPSPPRVSSRKRKAPEVKRESEDSEDDEVDEREIALLAELEKVRKEKRARKDANNAGKKVKQEPSHFFMPGEVIDLT